VLPGAEVALAAFILTWPWTILSEQFGDLFQFTFSIPWLLYIPIFGLFYLVGFAVQCFGELLGLIRIHRTARSNWRQRFKILWCGWDEESNIWWKEAHKEVVHFHGVIQKGDERNKQFEWAQLQQERLIVLKQMCANGFLASCIAGLFLVFRLFSNMVLNEVISGRCLAFVTFGLVAIVAVLLTISLLWGYRVHELRLNTMEQEILSSLGEDRKRGNTDNLPSLEKGD
jgi:hypothetical protein